jgi:hypothetical protein
MKGMGLKGKEIKQMRSDAAFADLGDNQGKSDTRSRERIEHVQCVTSQKYRVKTRIRKRPGSEKNRL